MLRALDLFSGIGGISVALADYARTIGYVEIDKYAQSVLLSRMADGDIETAPIFRDITRLDGTKLRGSIDLICGGFPCQDISVAGLGRGLDGERSGLFFEIVRLIKEIRPVFIFLENVPAIRTRGLDVVLKEITQAGYDCRWTTISAASVGANHKRERWFLLAYSNSDRNFEHESRLDRPKNSEEKIIREKFSATREFSKTSPVEWNYSMCGLEVSHSLAYANGSGFQKDGIEQQTTRFEQQSIFADSMCKGLERQWEESLGVKQEQQNTLHDSWWAVEPDVGRVVNGLPHRVDRIKCLGNSVVPLQVKTAFERLIGYASI